MSPHPRSFTDTLGIWHSQPVYYESDKGLITRESGTYRVWVKTRHGTYHLNPLHFDEDRFDYCRSLLDCEEATP
jgi:hypothetical protein